MLAAALYIRIQIDFEMTLTWVTRWNMCCNSIQGNKQQSTLLVVTLNDSSPECMNL